MHSRFWIRAFCFLQLVALSLSKETIVGDSSRPVCVPAPAKRAYVTLMTGSDEYVWGAKALAVSLQTVKSQADLVVLVTSDVDFATRRDMESVGYKIKEVAQINDHKDYHNGVHGRRFTNVMTKLAVWNLTEYERVVYFDADILVVRNVDSLFQCHGFCGQVSRPGHEGNKFNTGVMVLEPNTTVFNEMVENIGNLESFDGADMGYLNAFYSQFPTTRQLFVPSDNYSTDKDMCGNTLWSELTPYQKTTPSFYQLSPLYNYQIHWFNNGKWFYYFDYSRLGPHENDSSPHVIQFASAHKPWHSMWYLVKPKFWVWDSYRRILPFAYGNQSSEPSMSFLVALVLNLMLLWAFYSFPSGIQKKKMKGITQDTTTPPNFQRILYLSRGAFGVVLYFVALYIGISHVENLWHPYASMLVLHCWACVILLVGAFVFSRVKLGCTFSPCVPFLLCLLQCTNAFVSIAICGWVPSCEQPKFAAVGLQLVTSCYFVAKIFCGQLPHPISKLAEPTPVSFV